MFSKAFQDELLEKFTQHSASKKNIKFGQKGVPSESKKFHSKISEPSKSDSSSKPMLEVVGDREKKLSAKNESLDGNEKFHDYAQRVKNSKANAYVAFIDIFQFSSTIKNMTIENVKSYLNRYYERIFKIIKEFNGQIDKIMGDGVVVLFSDAFGIPYEKSVGETCLDFCKKCVESFYNSDSAVKAAIGSGELFFAETGAENTYEECSCIGHPMTMAFRLEDKANVNQILILMNDKANDVSQTLEWTWVEQMIDLKGVGGRFVRFYEYDPRPREAAEKICPGFQR